MKYIVYSIVNQQETKEFDDLHLAFRYAGEQSNQNSRDAFVIIQIEEPDEDKDIDTSPRSEFTALVYSNETWYPSSKIEMPGG